MTLSTDVYILDPVDPVDVFRYCQTLLSAFDEEGRSPDQQQSEVDNGWRGSGSLTMQNTMGQDLPAWLMLHYRRGAPLVTEEQAAECDEDCESDCDGEYHPQPCWINVDFDTAYSYRGPNGMGCGDLHAVLVAGLGQWLDQHGVRWAWRNEYTGEVHDNAESLIELVSGGFEAKAWLESTVLPAIMGRMS